MVHLKANAAAVYYATHFQVKSMLAREVKGLTGSHTAYTELRIKKNLSDPKSSLCPCFLTLVPKKPYPLGLSSQPLKQWDLTHKSPDLSFEQNSTGFSGKPSTEEGRLENSSSGGCVQSQQQ